MILCLLALVFCGSKQSADTTAATGTDGCEYVWGEKYVVDVPATCFAEGTQSIHYTKCGEVKPGSSLAVERTAQPSAEDYDVIGGYGWHRIVIRYYQTAAISCDEVVYTMTYTLYVDGSNVNEVLM